MHFLGPGLLPNPSFPRNNSKCNFFWSDFLTGRQFQCEFENMMSSGRSLGDPSNESRYDVLMFHQHKFLEKIVKQTDLFVLFNPGFGTQTLGPSWLPTLKILLSSQKPILSTSHCLQDHQSDMKKLTSEENCKYFLIFLSLIFSILISFLILLFSPSHSSSFHCFIFS